MPRAAASSRIDIGRRASRRTVRARPKLIPSASATARRRSLSSTRSDISSQTSRAAPRGVAASIVAARAIRYASTASGSSSAAVRRAESRARPVVASRPSTSTTAPQAVSVHQAGRLAAQARGAAPVRGR